MPVIFASQRPRSFPALASAIVIGTIGGASPAAADVPSYDVQVISSIAVATNVRGASDTGYVVGDQVVAGVILPFVATLADGLSLLPLPEGYDSGMAFDVNDAGVVVGTVSDRGFPADLGEPAVWTPDGIGGYAVSIPEQFDTLPSPLGPLAIDGGQAVAINDAGTIVGWSRYQGFQGGPTTRFSLSEPPVDLGALGFTAQVRDLNDLDVAVGGRLRFDLNTATATDIGVPPPLEPGNVSFSDVIGFAINDANEIVVAADLASVSTENYLTYIHDDASGFTRLNPAQVPSRFVGFYDSNDLGDVAASGGVRFDAEDVLVPSFDSLLAPSAEQWNVGLGFIGNDRRVYTTATDASTGELAIVVLVPTSGPSCTDADDDGFAIEGAGCGPVDCDDTDASVNPGMTEIPGNGLDDDCDPSTPTGCAPAS